MKRFIIAAAVTAFLLGFGSGIVDAHDKTTICHVPPGNEGNPQTLELPPAALQAHLGDNEDGLHGGDYRGECEAPEPTGTPTPTGTPEPTQTPTPTETPRPIEDPSLTVAPVCVDDEGQFVWVVDIAVAEGQPTEFTLNAHQGAGQSLSVPAAVGDENMIVIGLVGHGKVTFALEGTDVSVLATGATEFCAGAQPTPNPGGPRGTLPPTDTAAEVQESPSPSWILAVVIVGMISGAIGAYVFCRR